MLEAFLWGALASGMLLVRAIIAYISWRGPKLRAVIMASSSGLRVAGWSLTGVAIMRIVVILVSALSAAAGYVLRDPASGSLGPGGRAFDQAFAAGALLTMLADTMVPEAYGEEREFTGALVVLGFAGSLGLAALSKPHKQQSNILCSRNRTRQCYHAIVI